MLFLSFRCLLLAVLVFHFEAVISEPKPMTAQEFVEVNRLSAAKLSPDGKYLLYLRSEVNWEINKEVKRYRLKNLKNNQMVETFQPQTLSETFGAATWLPNSSGFLSILKREGDEHKQAYLFDIGSNKLTQVTKHGEDVQNIYWHPSGKGFFFKSKIPVSPKAELALKNKKAIKEYETRQYSEVRYFDWVKKSSLSIVGHDIFIRDYSLARDGSTIVFQRTKNGLPDDQRGELWQTKISSEQTTRLTDSDYDKSNALVSPDNTRFAYIAEVNELGQPYYEDNIFVQEFSSDKPELILPGMAMEVQSIKWNAAGDGLYFLSNTGVRTNLYYYSFQEKTFSSLTSGDHEIVSWQYNSALDTHVFVQRNQKNPGEIYILRPGNKPEQVTHEYTDWPDKYLLPQQTAFSWYSQSGVKLEGLLVLPSDRNPDEPMPLVTITHGGPISSSKFGSWNLSRHVPVLSGQGYAVFLPNHRGSTGYGDKFLRDMLGGYFTNAHKDVLSGIDALVKAGVANPDQLIKMGWSAGGHMTNKLITFTNRFKAASSGAGVADWVSQYGESDLRWKRAYWFGGTPWQKNAPAAVYAQHSPITDAWKITTPTVFYNGEKDLRVPPTQTIMMYRATKASGTETELYIAPDQKHSFRKPYYRLFKINKDLSWFAHHLSLDPNTSHQPRVATVISH